MIPMNKLLLLLAHPALHKSRIHSKLIKTAELIEGVTVHDLYDRYPDFHINIKYEQQLLLAHDLLIWQFPLFWYNCPSLMKEWMDLVLEYNFAYGRRGMLLSGKKLLIVVSTGGRLDVYNDPGKNHFTVRQLLLPFQQSALLCGMEFLPPFVIYGAHRLDDPTVLNYLKLYHFMLSGLTDGTLLNEKRLQVEYFNDLII